METNRQRRRVMRGRERACGVVYKEDSAAVRGRGSFLFLSLN